MADDRRQSRKPAPRTRNKKRSAASREIDPFGKINPTQWLTMGRPQKSRRGSTKQRAGGLYVCELCGTHLPVKRGEAPEKAICPYCLRPMKRMTRAQRLTADRRSGRKESRLP